MTPPFIHPGIQPTPLGVNAGSATVSHATTGQLGIHSLSASFSSSRKCNSSCLKTLNEVLEQCLAAAKYSINEIYIYLMIADRIYFFPFIIIICYTGFPLRNYLSPDSICPYEGIPESTSSLEMGTLFRQNKLLPLSLLGI